MQYNNFHYLSTWFLYGTAQNNLLNKGPHNIFGSSIVKSGFFPSFRHTTYLLEFWVFNFGCYFCEKMLLGEPCNWAVGCMSPSTLCSPTACAYFVNKPYTNCILYDSSSTFLQATCLWTTNKLIAVKYISLLISLS